MLTYKMSERSAATGQIYDQNGEDMSGATYLNPVYTDIPVPGTGMLLK